MKKKIAIFTTTRGEMAVLTPLIKRYCYKWKFRNEFNQETKRNASKQVALVSIISFINYYIKVNSNC